MKVIKLNTKEKLNIYMNPTRQQILRQLNLSNTPMTPKMLADKLQISASGVQHHIKKLLAIDVIELDHQEMIRGIKASYYRPALVTVQIGLEYEDESGSQREVLIQDSIARVYDGFRTSMKERLDATEEKNYQHIKKWGDIMTGVIHLNEKESDELIDLITEYIDSHQKPSPKTSSWEYAVILYNTGRGGNG
ncbi:helix-turn-helix protein [Mobilisporobacter senegalensis]|uniref:Helix-turn-helix protein n=1 Tax=Mobilisporobacter senegalensis TaxID=1329262 RepID=A0A3N1XQ79_9FIRM|nr:helix-turn-helix domain-containing protein [Mobilisporobacter senegalensis]ROR27252.1 helix-turn-helix protein [Mobilisporobacter senegalensis]